MPKYLVQASYTAEGLKGLQKEKASGRKEAVSKAIEGLGGKLEAIYFAFGADDVVVIFDLPDNVAAARLAIAVGASGLIRTRTTPLLTVEEVDQDLLAGEDYVSTWIVNVRVTGDIVALSPALIVEPAQIDEMVSLLREVLATIA